MLSSFWYAYVVVLLFHELGPAVADMKHFGEGTVIVRKLLSPGIFRIDASADAAKHALPRSVTASPSQLLMNLLAIKSLLRKCAVLSCFSHTFMAATYFTTKVASLHVFHVRSSPPMLPLLVQCFI